MNQEEQLIQLKDPKAILYLLRFAKPYWRRFSISILMLVASAMSGVWSARYLGQLAERGFLQRDLDFCIYVGTVVISLEIGAIVLTYYGRKLLAQASLKSVSRIREALFDHLQALPMKFFDRQPQGRIVTRVTHDVDTMEGFFSGTMARLLNAVITLFIVMISMLVADYHLGIMLILVMSPALAVTWLVRKPLRLWNREFAIRNSTINSRLSEFLNGLPVIRSFGVEKWSKDQFDGVIDHHLESAMAINRLNSWSRPLIMLLTSLPLAALLWVGGMGVMDASISLATFIMFVRFCERFMQPMNVISQEIHVVQTALTNTERVATFLQQETEEQALGQDGTYSAQQLRGEIEFQNLSMQYEEDRPVLKNVSFKVRAGEKIGLAGRTGSGKTSTLALLSRLYEFQEGDLLIDGISIRKYSRSSLRQRLGVVSQDAVIFEGTLRDNLSAGTLAEDAQILRACEETGLARIMKKNQLSLDSEILDQGANLSSGERQIISLTRILIKDPKILILDEATANIDPHFEKIIHDAVAKVMNNRTCFIIAHRLGTLAECDRILVFRDGQLVESGSHNDLTRQASYFGELLAQN